MEAADQFYNPTTAPNQPLRRSDLADGLYRTGDPVAR